MPEQTSLFDFIEEEKKKPEQKEKKEEKEIKEPPKEEMTSKPSKKPPVEEESKPHEEPVVIKHDERKLTLKIPKRERPFNFPTATLISVDYDGQAAKAFARLVAKKGKLVFWYDNTNHLPYCYTNLNEEILRSEKRIIQHEGFVTIEPVELTDLLRDRKILVSKVIARDPLSIGGKGNSLREIIKSMGGKAWEAAVRYRNSYVYDTNLILGMPYKIVENRLEPDFPEIPEDIRKALFERFKDESPEMMKLIEEYIPLFFAPAEDIKRVALDIEVYTPKHNVVPDANKGDQPITAVGLSANDGMNRILVLKRNDVPLGNKNDLPEGVKLEFYEREDDLLLEVFNVINEYPIVLTFVGDAFDLKYIYNRAQNLGIPRDLIPIQMSRDNEMALLKHGVHIDLYKFFKNPSLRIYAFSGAYDQTNLETIAQGLLKEGKIELDKEISQLSLYDLAHYCWQDANLTLRLTQYDNNLVIKLMMLFIRISKLSLEDMTRQGISSWIKSLFRYEHRKRKYLIPNQEDINEMKGISETSAMIKGKKFKGAIVVQPKAGIHFNTVVLDFASLYPSIIKTYNLSYETVRCPHKECRTNKVPDTNHWVCTKKKGIISLVVGLFRDIRVKWFKPMSKDKSLPEEIRSWYDVVQRALKVFVNASYGVMGAEHFELYCPPMAESVTAIGRYAIKKTIEKSESMGVSVLYGDTDSVFLENPTKEQIQELIQWSEKELGIELDVDKVYRYVALSGRKKNYFGVFENGKVDIKGLTGKKSNTPPLIQKAFYKMLEILSKVDSEEDFEKARDAIKNIVLDFKHKLENEDYDINDLAFRIQMTKSLERYSKVKPQHVRAAEILQSKKGVKIEKGQIIEFIKVRGKEGVMPVELAQKSQVDIDKYMDTLRSTFEQVLDALGLDYDEIMGKTTLDQFL